MMQTDKCLRCLVDVCITTDCEELARRDGGGPGDEMWKTCKLTSALAKRDHYYFRFVCS